MSSAQGNCEEFDVVLDATRVLAGGGVGGHLEFRSESGRDLVFDGLVSVEGGDLRYQVIGPNGAVVEISRYTNPTIWTRTTGKRTVESGTIVCVPFFLFSWGHEFLFPEEGMYKILVEADVFAGGAVARDTVELRVDPPGTGFQRWREMMLNAYPFMVWAYGSTGQTYSEAMVLELGTESDYAPLLAYFYSYHNGSSVIPRLLRKEADSTYSGLECISRSDADAALLNSRALAKNASAVSKLLAFAEWARDGAYGAGAHTLGRSAPQTRWWME